MSQQAEDDDAERDKGSSFGRDLATERFLQRCQMASSHSRLKRKRRRWKEKEKEKKKGRRNRRMRRRREGETVEEGEEEGKEK